MQDGTPTDKEFWDGRYAHGWGDYASPSAFLRAFTRLLPRDGRAIDIACGTGLNSILMAKNGLNVVGIDISGEALAIAKKNAEKSGKIRGTIKFIQGDALDVLQDTPDNTFAVITCINYNAPELFPEVNRLIAPGGMVLFQVFTVGDQRLSDSRMRDKLVSSSIFFEPRPFGGYWIISHEIDRFTDDQGYLRERVNFLARKPLA